jgi:hypothetical protein
MDVQIERATFVGHCGPDEILFACVNDGRYAILHNGVAVGVWGRADYAYCLGIYLRQIDRPADPPTAASLRLPRRRPGGASGISAKAS